MLDIDYPQILYNILLTCGTASTGELTKFTNLRDMNVGGTKAIITEGIPTPVDTRNYTHLEQAMGVICMADQLSDLQTFTHKIEVAVNYFNAHLHTKTTSDLLAAQADDISAFGAPDAGTVATLASGATQLAQGPCFYNDGGKSWYDFLRFAAPAWFSPSAYSISLATLTLESQQGLTSNYMQIYSASGTLPALDSVAHLNDILAAKTATYATYSGAFTEGTRNDIDVTTMLGTVAGDDPYFMFMCVPHSTTAGYIHKQYGPTNYPVADCSGLAIECSITNAPNYIKAERHTPPTKIADSRWGQVLNFTMIYYYIAKETS